MVNKIFNGFFGQTVRLQIQPKERFDCILALLKKRKICTFFSGEKLAQCEIKPETNSPAWTGILEAGITTETLVPNGPETTINERRTF